MYCGVMYRGGNGFGCEYWQARTGGLPLIPTLCKNMILLLKLNIFGTNINTVLQRQLGDNTTRQRYRLSMRHIGLAPHTRVKKENILKQARKTQGGKAYRTKGTLHNFLGKKSRAASVN